jgi:integrase
MTSNMCSSEISFAAHRLRMHYSVPADALRGMQNELMQAELSPNSRKAMGASLKVFARYCAAFDALALPATPQTVKDFITWAIRVRGYRLETIANVLWAVRSQHVDAGQPSPVDECVRTFWSNCRRAVKEPRRHKRALSVEQLRCLIGSYGSRHPMDLRDRALLSLGFASAMRRSELAALALADVATTRKGLVLTVRSSKTDQSAKGAFIAVPFGQDKRTCPVRAIKKWVLARGSWEGPLFVRFTGQREATRKRLSAPAVAAVLKRALERIGIESQEYGAHSLRAGMATAAAEAGASVIAIQMRTRHRSVESVMRYVRPAQAFQGDPLAGVL